MVQTVLTAKPTIRGALDDVESDAVVAARSVTHTILSGHIPDAETSAQVAELLGAASTSVLQSFDEVARALRALSQLARHDRASSGILCAAMLRPLLLPLSITQQSRLLSRLAGAGVDVCEPAMTAWGSCLLPKLRQMSDEMQEASRSSHPQRKAQSMHPEVLLKAASSVHDHAPSSPQDAISDITRDEQEQPTAPESTPTSKPEGSSNPHAAAFQSSSELVALLVALGQVGRHPGRPCMNLLLSCLQPHLPSLQPRQLVACFDALATLQYFPRSEAHGWLRAAVQAATSRLDETSQQDAVVLLTSLAVLNNVHQATRHHEPQERELVEALMQRPRLLDAALGALPWPPSLGPQRRPGDAHHSSPHEGTGPARRSHSS